MLRRFLADERGTATIEFVLWVPIFALILIVLVDATFVYLSFTQMLNASRDAARRASLGEISAVCASGTCPIDSFQTKNYPEYENMTLSRSGNQITVTTEEAFDDILAFTIFSGLLDDNLTTSVTMRVEPGV